MSKVFSKEELEGMLNEGKHSGQRAREKAEEYKNLSRDELAEKLKMGYFNKTTGKWKIDDSHGPMNLRSLSLVHKAMTGKHDSHIKDQYHYERKLGLMPETQDDKVQNGINDSYVNRNKSIVEVESEQLDEAKRPAHWHSHQLDNIEDMIASVGHTPHPTKFMANPSDADLAGHYEKEADKHGKLAQLNDTACFHAENSGRDYSCDKHKSMAEINIMKSDLYKTLAGLYQMSHDIEK